MRTENLKRTVFALTTAAMLAAAPICTYAEAGVEDISVEDISDAMIGLWQDDAGDIYGFYGDNSFFAQWVEEQTEVVGMYALVTDGEYTVLTMESDDLEITCFVEADEEANALILYNEEEDTTAELYPYDNEEDPYNNTYQLIAETLTTSLYGVTDADEVFAFAYNDDGSFCMVLVMDENAEYVSFVGEGTENDNGTITVTDEVSELALTFGIEWNEDDTYTLDMGDLGSAVVAEATIADVMDLLAFCTIYGTPVA